MCVYARARACLSVCGWVGGWMGVCERERVSE